MMNFRKRNGFYSVGKEQGVFSRWLGWCLYPFKKLWFWAVLLILALALPLLWGVKLTELHLWYGDKLKNAGANVSANIGKTIKVSPFATKGTDKLVQDTDNRPKNLRRQAFGKAETKPESIDVAEIESDIPELVPFFVPENDAVNQGDELLPNSRSQAAVIRVETPQHSTVSVHQRDDYRKDVEGLRYLDEILEISGRPLIYNANAIDLNGNYVFLYGIYADPTTEAGERAKLFLEREVENREVTCRIVAYTADEVATAICYLKGININRFMVDNGLSINVAL